MQHDATGDIQADSRTLLKTHRTFHGIGLWRYDSVGGGGRGGGLSMPGSSSSSTFLGHTLDP